MTGRGHRLFGAAFVAVVAPIVAIKVGLLAGCLVATGIMMGVRAPDWLEVRHGDKTLLKHRTITHLLVCWLALLLAGGWFIHRGYWPAWLLAGFAVGGITHWIGDVGTPMGVPVWHPQRRSSLRLWRGRTEMVPIAAAWALVVVFWALTLLDMSQVQWMQYKLIQFIGF